MMSSFYKIKAYTCAWAVVSFITVGSYAPLASAEGDNDAGTSTREAISKLYCENDGKLALCIGHKADECLDIVRPLVETCQRRTTTVTQDTALAFDQCFYKEFSRKYGSQIQLHAGCVSPMIVEGAIKPPPPEYADKGTPYPFGQGE